jgi:tRNA threonylcarbamoyl adenosine modification protein (Sua5/YciO/YrdC/YwlC family)
MAQFFVVHPENPQPRLIRRTAEILREGGVIAYPTDSCYALGCRMDDKAAVGCIRTIRQVDARHHFALLCRDLAQVAVYARINDSQYHVLRSAPAGVYTFILQATRELPRRIQHPRRKTIGVRIPAHPVARALLVELGEPVLSSTLLLPGDETPLADAQEIRARLERDVALVLDGGSCGTVPTTVVDMTGQIPVILREGKGPVDLQGAAHAAT